MIKYGKSRIILVCVLVAMLAAIGTFAAVFAAGVSGGGSGYTKINARNIVAKGDREVTLINTEESTDYVVKMSVTPTTRNASSRLGVCAGKSACNQFVEFTLDCSTDTFYSNVEFFGSTNGTGYGKASTLASPAVDETEITVVRNGKMFYFVVDGKLVQIREVDMQASTFGYSVERGGATFVGSYTTDKAEVEAAVKKYSDNGGLNFGQKYANVGVYEKTENGFKADDRLVNYGFERSVVGWGDEYEGSISVEYDLTDIKFNPENDRGGTAYPKAALVVYNERGYLDYLCLGVADKSDRIETGLGNGFRVWWNHNDITGDSSLDSTLDLSGGVHIRVDIINTLTTKLYQIYVNGAIAAERTSFSYGNIKLGFAFDYASATVENIVVRAI